MCLCGISPAFRADRVMLGLTVSSNNVPLDIYFSPCPLSSTLLWSNAVWHVRGLMLQQAIYCPFWLSVKQDQIREGDSRRGSVSQLKKSLFIFNQIYFLFYNKSLCRFVLCRLLQCSHDMTQVMSDFTKNRKHNWASCTIHLFSVTTFWIWAERVADWWSWSPKFRKRPSCVIHAYL